MIMTPHGTRVPKLPLRLSMSPLLPSISNGLSSALVTRGTSSSLSSMSLSPTANFHTKPLPPTPEILSSTSSVRSLPASNSKNSFPASPSITSTASKPEEVTALFSTLQRMNEDVAYEARRVHAVIKDARDFVNNYREEIKMRANQVKMQQNKKATREGHR